MNIEANGTCAEPVYQAAAPYSGSPITSSRIKALAKRLIEGAPALTVGEMRELADAILDHNARSAAQA